MIFICFEFQEAEQNYGQFYATALNANSTCSMLSGDFGTDPMLHQSFFYKEDHAEYDNIVPPVSPDPEVVNNQNFLSK